jgi:hypothetical protein
LGILAGLLALSVATQAAPSRIHPEGSAGEVRIRIAKKRSAYDLALPDTPVRFRLHGPRRIRVLHRFLPGSGDLPESYSLLVLRNGVPAETLEAVVRLSTKARLEDGGPIGRLQRAILSIPAGPQEITLRPLGEAKVLVRILPGTGKKRAPKIRWVSFSPDSSQGPIILRGGDTETTYYRFGSDPVVLDVIGPLRMKIRSRIDFTQETGKRQTYRLLLALDGRPWKSFLLQSRPSHTVVYPDLPQITPGTKEDVEVEIPDGRHRLHISLGTSLSGTGSLRLLVPEEDLRRQSG